MPRKIGGLVCDTESCRKFVDYWDDNVIGWQVTASNQVVCPKCQSNKKSNEKSS